MVSLNQQKYNLIQSAAQHQIPQEVMVYVVDLLANIANHLDQVDYYVLTYPDQSWFALNTADQQWILAFGYQEDAEDTLTELQIEASALSIQTLGVLDLLFLCLGLKQADGIAFYDSLGDRQSSKTIAQAALRQQLNHYLRSVTQQPPIA